MEERTDTVRAGLRDLRRLLVGADYPPPPGNPSRRWRRWRRHLLQGALIALLGLTVSAAQYLLDERHLHEGLAVLVAAGSTLPVALVLRRPLLAWRIAYPMLYLGVIHARPEESFPWNPVQIFAFIAVLAVLAVRVDTGVAAWAGLLCLLPAYLFAGQLANAYGITVLIAIILILGDQVRRRRQTQRALVEQAEQSELEKARRAVLEERTRIARELHDVVAHHMSMIAVQAETAPYRLDSLPEPARTEFTAIADSARLALTDMRRLLGVLRSESTGPQTAPQPGLADIPALVEAAHRAGMAVTLDLPEPATGAPEPPGAVGLAAYRIVQEALANAARHAPGAPVRVALRAGRRELDLRISNGGGRGDAGAGAGAGNRAGGRGDDGDGDGAGAGNRAGGRGDDDDGDGGGGDGPGRPHRPAAGPDRPEGHGLIGMRERARLLGGTFDAGTGEDGFVVVARLPYDGPGDGAR
jgi:signal transduction histidine kinase